ncbi:hypothetical protein MGH68_06135 [Erysipelothrix sp. D19-032]
MVQVVNDNDGNQVTFNTYPANVKRLAAIVEQSPRPVVPEASYAHILKQCLNIDTPYYVRTETFGLNPDLRVDYDMLLADSKEYLWQVVADHADLKGGGVYIHSDAKTVRRFRSNLPTILRCVGDERYSI